MKRKRILATNKEGDIHIIAKELKSCSILILYSELFMKYIIKQSLFVLQVSYRIIN